MKKKLLKELVMNSYQNGVLNEQTAHAIANHLGRKELKEYIKALKAYEQTKTVVVETAKPITIEQKAMIADTFTDKKTNFVTNASLITGIRIIDNDIIYEANLQRVFDKIIQHIEKHYD